MPQTTVTAAYCLYSHGDRKFTLGLIADANLPLLGVEQHRIFPVFFMKSFPYQAFFSCYSVCNVNVLMCLWSSFR